MFDSIPEVHPKVAALRDSEIELDIEKEVNQGRNGNVYVV
jgi:hypothetical protein